MMNDSNQFPKHLLATSSNELPWLAFCYVANELDSQTRREFEIRLEHDQAAREAVAQAFDNALMLDQALASEVSELSAGVNELSRPKSKSELKRPVRSTLASPKPVWATALIGIGIAGLLALILLQLPWKPRQVEIAQNANSPTLTERTNASVSLAETWADSDWDIELETDIEADSNQLDPNDRNQEFVLDDEQDDWMSATLIDMAEEPKSPSPRSGS